MKTRTDTLLVVLNVLTWIAFFGLIAKAGAILISYGVSIGNPDGAKNLYLGLNWSNLREFDFWHYTGSVALIVAILFLEAYLAYLLTRVLSKIKMTSPFTIEVAKILQKMSYVILFTWVVSLLYNGHMEWLAKQINGLQKNLVSVEFLFLAGVVFVLAQIFKKGVEIQTENELTV